MESCFSDSDSNSSDCDYELIDPDQRDNASPTLAPSDISSRDEQDAEEEQSMMGESLDTDDDKVASAEDTAAPLALALAESAQEMNEMQLQDDGECLRQAVENRFAQIISERDAQYGRYEEEIAFREAEIGEFQKAARKHNKMIEQLEREVGIYRQLYDDESALKEATIEKLIQVTEEMEKNEEIVAKLEKEVAMYRCLYEDETASREDTLRKLLVVREEKEKNEESTVMLKSLSALEQMEIVGVENVVDFANKVFKNQYIAPSVLIFKYEYAQLKEAIAAHKKLIDVPEAEQNAAEIEKAAKLIDIELEYAESLNSWLGQGLLDMCTSLGVHMIELGGNHGTAFRFCPLEHAAANSSNMERVQTFVKQLSEVMSVVDSTVAARRSFADMKVEFPTLAQLPINKWAGVGAVCYIPSIVKETNPEEWNEKQRQQVSMLNMELVDSLRSVDSAFSSGESALIGVSCVKFGMLSDANHLVGLMRMVSERGKEIENSQLKHIANSYKQESNDGANISEPKVQENKEETKNDKIMDEFEKMLRLNRQQKQTKFISQKAVLVWLLLDIIFLIATITTVAPVYREIFGFCEWFCRGFMLLSSGCALWNAVDSEQNRDTRIPILITILLTMTINVALLFTSLTSADFTALCVKAILALWIALMLQYDVYDDVFDEHFDLMAGLHDIIKSTKTVVKETLMLEICKDEEGSIGFGIIADKLGFVVNYIHADSDAAKKGLQKRDEIVRINGFSVNREKLSREVVVSLLAGIDGPITLKVRRAVRDFA